MIPSESMKPFAFVLVLLGCLQVFVTCDYQVTALYEIKMHLNDDGGVLKDWKDNQMTPCNWGNIICQDNKVIAITLSSTGLAGVLSPSIGKLTTLQQLLLDGNMIGGTIPEALGDLSSLTILNLGRNIFNGSIPDSLGRLQKLQNL
ncbi:hypothetical protein HU200_006486 [Digitaria exilis]|uniref:Leucine-rich repeat-containing N-terminal plant-type domain-containing protein n=1 Tax=Digitaria exilis TaxID=1010633 RepID=A0A835FNX1_9POAL|nr:hypothetical protein HU200_006486 [Digitaria exilis]